MLITKFCNEDEYANHHHRVLAHDKTTVLSKQSLQWC